MRVAPLHQRWLDHHAVPETCRFEGRCRDQPLTRDVGQRHFAFTSESHCAHRHSDVFFCDDSTRDDGRDDAMGRGFEHDVFDVARFRSIGGADDVLVFANAEDRVISSR
jgi:hypothetical protein